MSDAPKPQTTTDALIRARSALMTCLDDESDDLSKPERRSVIERRIREITDILKINEHSSTNIPYPRKLILLRRLLCQLDAVETALKGIHELIRELASEDGLTELECLEAARAV